MFLRKNMIDFAGYSSKLFLFLNYLMKNDFVIGTNDCIIVGASAFKKKCVCEENINS